MNTAPPDILLLDHALNQLGYQTAHQTHCELEKLKGTEKEFQIR
jgi:hypothetical protein